MFSFFRSARRFDPGICAALASSLMWGALPLYWHLLEEVPPFFILCQRIVWSCVFLFPLVVLTNRLAEVTRAARSLKTLGAFTCSSFVLAVNWGVYIWAVNNGKVVEASLGYFICPLINVCLGVLFFRDRPGPVRLAAIAIAFCGIFTEMILNGSLPWVGLVLSLSFSSYALLRKLEPVESLPGLMLETAILCPFALICIFWFRHSGMPFTVDIGAAHLALLIGSGVVTSTPLILYGYGARHLPFTTLGLLQYVSPLMTACLGIFFFHESVSTGRVISLMSIWLALVVYTVDSLRSYSRAHGSKKP